MAEKLKILVVDDNEELCSTLKDILELKDFEVATACDGFQCLDRASKERFDLVLMDIRMPAMDGVETFKKLKTLAPETPTIMMTAFALEDLVRNALREGAFGALKKPLDFERLFELLKSSQPGGALVLVVDDDPDISALLEAVLAEKGYRVSLAGSSDEALQKARTEKFDIAIIDLRLPGPNGFETYQAMRDIRPDTTAIMITGYAEMAPLGRKALNQDAYALLEKPLDMPGLLQLLEEIRGQRDAGTLRKPG